MTEPLTSDHDAEDIAVVVTPDDGQGRYAVLLCDARATVVLLSGARWTGAVRFSTAYARGTGLPLEWPEDHELEAHQQGDIPLI